MTLSHHHTASPHAVWVVFCDGNGSNTITAPEIRIRITDGPSCRTILQFHKPCLTRSLSLATGKTRSTAVPHRWEMLQGPGHKPRYVRVLAVLIFKVSLLGLCMFRRQGVWSGNSQPVAPSHRRRLMCLC